MQLNPQLEASSVLAWTLLNGFVNEYNKPFEFTNHRFLIDYMADEAPTKVTKKAAQIGLTTVESLTNFHTAAYKKMNIIHTLQTSDVIKGFVFPKINPIINYNPKIKELMRVDSESLKQFGDNFIFYRGAQSESQAINITADMLCIDEYDRSNQKIVEMYQSRLDASPYKWKRYFSNPSAIGFGVDGLYQKSDQRHWMVKCSHCNHRSYMDFALSSDTDNHFVDMERAIFACGKCHKEIYDKDRINGEWVAKYPDRDWHGYWFSQLMAPWMSAPHIIEKQQMNSIEYFSNFVLGKAFTPTDLIVSRETILNACEPKQIPKLQVAIGVDVGHVKHWVAATPEGIFDMGKTESWEEIEKLILMYNATAVIDAMPDFTIPKQLMEKYKGRVFICYYKQDTQNAGAVRFKTGKDYGIVHADRTKIFDLVATEINNKMLKFRTEPSTLGEYIVHWGNTFRTTEIDSKGFERPIWTKDPSKPEHYCHATIYMRIALSRQLGRGFGMDFAEPNTSFPKPTGGIVRDGAMTFDLSAQIKEAMET